ncbi:MAG: phytase [Cyanobacteria bacterium P01_D01_bin.1]
MVTAAAADNSRKRQSLSGIESGIEFIGEVQFPTGLMFAETEVGGLSALAYDMARDVYYALADDRSEQARFYTARIDLSDRTLDPGDITFDAVTTLLDKSSGPFISGSLDPEGIALTDAGTLYIASEGDANQLISPFIREIALDGSFISELPVPELYLPTADSSSGIRNNQAFESLTITPDQRFLYTATEGTLNQDGPLSDVDQPGLSRILKYDLTTGEPVASFVYEVEPVPNAPVPEDGFRTNGLVELLAVDNNGTLLALERSFSAGVGNMVKLFEVQTQGALDVSGVNDLFREAPLEDDGEILPPGPFEIDPAVIKRELLDIERDLGVAPDNLEALAFGPQLDDGRQSLIIASDNNFNETQVTQFLALAVEATATPAALPIVETPITQDDEDADTPLRGDSDDPAIWVHPADTSESVVIGTLKDGGLAVFDLQGEILQTVLPQPFGEIRYNNVDLVYGFELNGERVDLAVVSDRANDTLAIFNIDPDTRQLEDITSTSILETIFGVDDGEATAYGLATYTSPVSGTSYAFVTQADGNQVAQLELTEDNGTVGATVVRTLQLPVPTGDLEDSQSEGLVVDQELGLLYVALENEVGILKFSAEPTGGDSFQVIQPIGADYLTPDIEGLSIYYGADGSGYLIANSQGDSSYAVFSRQGPNEYLGSFVVGDNGDIDQVNESDGLDIINIGLGSAFPNGLIVLQDGANDPQNAVEDEEELENNSTNFKFVPWESVADSFENALETDPNSFDPRNPLPQSLVNGVASGDVTSDSAVLWTRSTFTGEITFEYSTDSDFATVEGTATVQVTDINQPVKVDVEGLAPGTEYFYRATDAAGDRATGRFVTAAALGEQTGLNFGISGDWQQAPPYPILNSAAQSNLDFFVKLGDTIYADLETPATPGVSQARTLDQFRAKHSEVISPRFGSNAVSDLYETTSILASIDDHEIVDNFAGGAAPGDSPDAPDIGSSPDPLFTDDVAFVNDTQVYEDALQAYQEYHPLRDEFYDTPEDARTDGERKLYRANDYGSDASVFVLDSRSFRDDQLEPADLSDPTSFIVQTFDPSRTLLGKAQLEEVKADLLAAQSAGTTWKFVLIPEPIQNFGVVNAEDRFEGYAAERTELLSFVDNNNIENVVFMAGDFHGTIVNNLTYQLGPGQEQIATSAFEVVTGPVAFFDGRFGPNVANLSAAAGLISEQELAFYNSLPVAPDGDSELNDKDDFVKQLLVAQTNAFGYDPVGLNNNLAQAEGKIDATLLAGDYVAAHNFSWSEFDIDPNSQKLTVTTYGIDAYSEAEVLANPGAVLDLEPVVISQFEVNPQGNILSGSDADDVLTDGDESSKLAGLMGSDLLAGGLGDDVILGGSGDDVLRGDRNSRSAQTGKAGGDDLIYGGAGNDRIGGKSGNDRLFGDSGNDQVWGDDGDDLIYGGLGNDILTGDNFSGGQGIDTFMLATGEGTDTIVDFETGTDLIGLLGGLSFGQLTFAGSEIRVGEEVLATLNNVMTADLTAASFTVIG